jgi:hypothetical protein
VPDYQPAPERDHGDEHMNHDIPGAAAKQHALTRSLSWLTTTTLEKRRPSISKQAAPKIKKIVSKMLTICSLS